MNNENSDAVNRLIGIIKEKMSDSSDNNATSGDISSILNTLNSNSSSQQNNNDNNENGSNNSIDPSIFLKIQKIMSAMGSNTPQKDLLLSLKPFLRKSRQDKFNDYLTILSIISILENLKEKGSD